MSGGFIIEPIGAHDRSAFSCGTLELDLYLRERALQDMKRLVASCFVLIEKATNSVAGYYTLSAYRRKIFLLKFSSGFPAILFYPRHSSDAWPSINLEKAVGPRINAGFRE